MIGLNPIGTKTHFKDEDMVCYCFQYTKKSIKDDFLQNGYSIILERIKNEKKNNGCNCEIKNPKGKWCLGDVHQVVEEIKDLQTINKNRLWGTNYNLSPMVEQALSILGNIFFCFNYISWQY